MRVGLIGCGRIAFEAHLPAYKKYGVEVVAVCDLIEERAKRAAEEYQIADWYTSAADMAANENVQLIDIATPPHGRIGLLRSLYKFNKPMLIQKPLSYDYSEAELICREIKEQNVVAAVNHNARWAPVSEQLTKWLATNKLGELFLIHHVNRYNEDLKSWYTDEPDYLFLDHGIHYFDLIRQFTNKMPVQVSALSTSKPGQVAACPLTYTINMKFTDQLIASLYFNNAVPGPNSFACNWYLDGSEGSVHATLDSVSYHGRNQEILPMERLSGDWVPEGFWGSYKTLVDCINNNIKIPHSVDDHLLSFKLAVAAAKSASENGNWITIE